MSQDLARRALFEPLLDALAPTSVLACWVDDDPASVPVWPDVGGRELATCRADGLAGALDAAHQPVVWFCGCPGWHSLRRLGAVLARRANGAAPLPVIVVEGTPRPPLPAWSTNAAYAADLARGESAKDGVRLAVDELADALDPDATVLWCAPGAAGAVVLPAATASRLAPWLAGRGALLDALRNERDGRAALVARNFALFELLDRAQRTGTAVVTSLRFRVGTRVVRAGRRIRRDEAVFRAPREILARRPVVEKWRARLATERVVGESPPAGSPKVTFVLPELRLSGGGLVVSELVNELRVIGADARIATLKARADVFRMRFLDPPMVFDTIASLQRDVPAADLFVATHWSTAEWVRKLGSGGRAAYFVQDYEAWFYPEADAAIREQVIASYGLIADKIATSAWLAGLLRADGYEARTVPPGLDLDVFYPRRVEASTRPTVLAMARPRTPRRGFDAVVATLERVHDAVPEAQIVLFGERLGEMRLPFPYRGEGVITDQEQLARVYSSARVHFDGSDFQAFGRAALEAMACGTVSVLTNVGGVHEYARDNENSLLVPPRDPTAAADAIVRLLRDDALEQRLRANGLDTAAGWSMRRRARAHLDIYNEIVGAPARPS